MAMSRSAEAGRGGRAGTGTPGQTRRLKVGRLGSGPREAAPGASRLQSVEGSPQLPAFWSRGPLPGGPAKAPQAVAEARPIEPRLRPLEPALLRVPKNLEHLYRHVPLRAGNGTGRPGSWWPGPASRHPARPAGR